MARFYEEAPDGKAATQCARSVLERPDASDEQRLEAHLLLAGEAGKLRAAWRSIPRPEATKHLRAALRLAKTAAGIIQVAARLVRHLGLEKADLQGAGKQYLEAEELVKANVLTGRLKMAFRDATMAMGDAHLYAGKVEKAIKDYQTAEALAEPVIPPQVRSAKIGAYPERIEQAIANGKADEAAEVVQEWYEQLPADMPRGEVLFWMGKVESLRGNPRAAIRPLTTAIDLGQGAPFEAEGRWLLAEAHRRVGDPENHRANLVMLVRSLLGGPWREKAIRALKKLKGK